MIINYAAVMEKGKKEKNAQILDLLKVN